MRRSATEPASLHALPTIVDLRSALPVIVMILAAFMASL
jgi:hypothetical protein